jgi:hypothetical protein
MFNSNKLVYFLVAKSAYSTRVPMIRDLKYPACINCVHFIKETSLYENEESPTYYTLSKCKLFGSMNLLTGKIKYEYAELCRHSRDQCGISGKLYEEKNKN